MPVGHLTKQTSSLTSPAFAMAHIKLLISCGLPPSTTPDRHAASRKLRSRDLTCATPHAVFATLWASISAARPRSSAGRGHAKTARPHAALANSIGLSSPWRYRSGPERSVAPRKRASAQATVAKPRALRPTTGSSSCSKGACHTRALARPATASDASRATGLT